MDDRSDVITNRERVGDLKVDSIVSGKNGSGYMLTAALAKLQLASFQRIKQKRAERRPFFTYVDEFQNFAAVSFVEMLSEARKYKLFLTMAEQTTSQQDDPRIVNTILTNAGTIICFKTNSPVDEQQMLHLFDAQVQPGEIINLPTYNFYIRLAGIEPQGPTSGKTGLPDDDGDPEIAEAVIEASKKNYAIEYKAPPKPKPTAANDKAKSDAAKAPRRKKKPENKTRKQASNK